MQGTELLRDPEFVRTLERSPFQARDLPGLSSAVADTFERLTPEQRKEFKEVIDQLDDLTEEQLQSFLRMIAYVESNPDQYPKLIEQLVAAGALKQGEIPNQYDPNLIAIIKTMVAQALSRVAQKQGVPGFAAGGIVSLKQKADEVRQAGRRGDTMLAHITPFEANMLKRMGGSGTINPKTNLPEFGFWDSTFGRILKIGAQVLGTVVLTPFVGPIAAGAIVGGVSSLLSGGSASDALKGALFGGITGGIGGGVSSVLGGGGFLEGAFSGGSLFGGGLSSMFGGTGGAPAAGAAGAEGATPLPAEGPVPPVRPAQETVDALAAAQQGAAPPTVSPTAASRTLGESFSRAFTPEGMKEIWANYKVPIVLGGGAALIGLSSMGGGKRPRRITSGKTGAQLLEEQPGKYGFEITDFAQQAVTPSPSIFPGGQYVAPSTPAQIVRPPDFRQFAYENPYEMGIMSAKVGGHINGPGTGTSDSIPARLSDGEFVMTAKAVRGAGNGDRMKGARKMYELMHKFERMS